MSASRDAPDAIVERSDQAIFLQRSQLPTEGITIDGIEADAKGVWIYGHAYIGKEPSRLYLERVDFDHDE